MKPRHLAAAAALAALILGLSTTAAQAWTTYTPHGGNFDLQSTNTSFTDVSSSLHPTITCGQASIDGSVSNSGFSRGYGVIAVPMGHLLDSGCSNSILGPATVTPTGALTFAIDGDSSTVGGDIVWPASLDQLTASVSLPGCSFTIEDGSGSGGTVDGTFDQTTQTFTPNGGNLEVNAGTVSGSTCALAGISGGDSIVMGGVWTNTGMPLTITNP